MVALVKSTWPGLLMVTLLAKEIPKGVIGWVNLAAIATIVAGIFVVARYKAALEAADKATTAVQRERDAEYERAERLEKSVFVLEAQVSQNIERINLIQEELKRKPDLTTHQAMLQSMGERMDAHAAAAQRRDDLLVAALDRISVAVDSTSDGPTAAR